MLKRTYRTKEVERRGSAYVQMSKIISDLLMSKRK